MRRTRFKPNNGKRYFVCNSYIIQQHFRMCSVSFFCSCRALLIHHFVVPLPRWGRLNVSLPTDINRPTNSNLKHFTNSFAFFSKNCVLATERSGVGLLFFFENYTKQRNSLLHQNSLLSFAYLLGIGKREE